MLKTQDIQISQQRLREMIKEEELSKHLEDQQIQEEPELRVQWNKIVAWYTSF